MLRKLVILALIAAVAGGAMFWVLTIPQMVSASSLSPHARSRKRQDDICRRRMRFLSCDSTAGRSHASRWWPWTQIAFGTFYAPNISPDRNEGIGAWSEADFVTAMVKARRPTVGTTFPRFLHIVSAHELRRSARSLRVSENAAAGAGQGARS
jgi:hypothetical protein